jgi:hypothetical protein
MGHPKYKRVVLKLSGDMGPFYTPDILVAFIQTSTTSNTFICNFIHQLHLLSTTHPLLKRQY